MDFFLTVDRLWWDDGEGQKNSSVVTSEVKTT